MTNISHPDMVRSLVKPGEVIAAEMEAHEADLWHGATGVCGETVEILEAVWTGFAEQAIDMDNMLEELGDMEFYLQQVRDNLGITREATLGGSDDLPVSMPNSAIALAIQGGNLLDQAKKVSIYKKPVDVDAFVGVLSKIEVFMERLRNDCGFTREETLVGNVAKLSVRYAGLTYSNQAAQDRADKA